MTVGILIVSHEQVGNALVEAATITLGFCPLEVIVQSIHRDCEPERQISDAQRNIEQLNAGDGVLVITDIFGSTPSNIACAMKKTTHVEVVSGANLPMLIRIFNYPRLNLQELVEKAISGGREGIMDCKIHYF